MKKYGFTLAEVLITLGIIGVVAALTTPALVKNSGKAKIGPSLAKFVNTFETGVEQMMEKEVLSEMSAENIPLLNRYIIMTPIDDDTYEFQGGSGTKYKPSDVKTSYTNSKDAAQNIATGDRVDREGLYYECYDQDQAVYDACVQAGIDAAQNRMEEFTKLLSGLNTYQLKDGSVMSIIPVTKDKISTGAYKGVIAEVIVDIDGNRGENKAGKDVFGFLLDRTGTLIPAGSNAHKYIGQSGDVYIKKYESSCNTSSGDLDLNLACTGKIADKNYKYEE